MARPEEEKYKRQQQKGRFLSFPARPEAHSVLFVFKDYSYAKRESYEGIIPVLNTYRTIYNQTGISAALSNASGIELPFPKQLKDDTELRLNGFERSIITEKIASYISENTRNVSMDQIGSVASGIANEIGSAAYSFGAAAGDPSGGSLSNKIQDMLSKVSMQDVATSAAYLLRTFLPGDMARSVGVYNGNIVNPKETIAFEGVNLKSHMFSWELFPYGREDSLIIRNIVDFLKVKSLPASTDISGLGIRRAFLKYPSVVEIHLLGVDQQHFTRFKPCMIQSVNVDYGATGTVPIMSGGKPGSVQLAIQLQELEIHTANDYGVNTTASLTEQVSALGDIT